MSKDSEFQKRLFRQLSTVIGGVEMLNDRISGSLEGMDHFETEFAKLSRKNNQLRSDILGVKSEVTQFRSDVNQWLHGDSKQ